MKALPILIIGGVIGGIALLVEHEKSKAILTPGSSAQKAAVNDSVQKTLEQIAAMKAAAAK